MAFGHVSSLTMNGLRASFEFLTMNGLRACFESYYEWPSGMFRVPTTNGLRASFVYPLRMAFGQVSCTHYEWLGLTIFCHLFIFLTSSNLTPADEENLTEPSKFRVALWAIL